MAKFSNCEMFDNASCIEKSNLDSRVRTLRNWIGNYRKMKQWQNNKLNNLLSSSTNMSITNSGNVNNDIILNNIRSISPLDTILKIIKDVSNPQQLLECAKKQELRGLHRNLGLKYLNDILSSTKYSLIKVNLISVLSHRKFLTSIFAL